MTTTQNATEAIDLSFAPVQNTSPSKLTAEQIDYYNRNGYLLPFDIFKPLEAVRNRAYFDYLLAELQALEDGRDNYAINGYHTRCRGIYRIATDPRILDLVQDIVGPNIVCWATHFFCKLPHDPKAVAWHQDASYWPLTPARTVTVWLAIDDADEENSAMKLIPGTHNRGHLKWREVRGPAVLNQEIEDVESLGTPISVNLRAGQISLHADMIAHGSDPNRSARRRCGLTLRYCPPIVRSNQPSWMTNAIVCRGTDPTGLWTHNNEPLGEDVTTRSRPKNIGGN